MATTNKRMVELDAVKEYLSKIDTHIQNMNSEIEKWIKFSNYLWLHNKDYKDFLRVLNSNIASINRWMNRIECLPSIHNPIEIGEKMIKEMNSKEFHYDVDQWKTEALKELLSKLKS